MVLKNESILSLCQTCTARSSSSFVHLALILLAGSGKTLHGHKIRTLEMKIKILCNLPKSLKIYDRVEVEEPVWGQVTVSGLAPE